MLKNCPLGLRCWTKIKLTPSEKSKNLTVPYL